MSTPDSPALRAHMLVMKIKGNDIFQGDSCAPLKVLSGALLGVRNVKTRSW